MNASFMKKVLGLSREDLVWDEEMSRYKDHLERESFNPIPLDKIHLLIGEMTTPEKRQIAMILQFTIKNNKKKKFLETLFLKELHLFLQQCRKEKHNRIKLILALWQVLASTMEEEEDLSTFIEKQDEKINEHGPWHYYWAFYLHPSKHQHKELWEQNLIKIEAHIKEITNQIELKSKENKDGITEQAEDMQEQTLQVERKLQLLEKKLTKVVEHRQQLEKELVLFEKEKKQKNQLIENLQYQVGDLEQQLRAQIKEQENLQLQGEEEIRNRDKRNADLKGENFKLLALLDSRSSEIEELKRELSAMLQLKHRQEDEIAQLKKERKALREENEQITNIPMQVEDINVLMYEEINRLNQTLLGRKKEESIDSVKVRQKMKLCLTIIDLIEDYVECGYYTNDDSQSTTIENTFEAEHEHEIDKQIEGEYIENIPESFFGTFYRRDHGGFVRLENGETFNITESMVYENGLQHEAEVECTPSGVKNGITFYTVKLLFQGDDDYSDVLQYDGYIELGKHNTLYCVDLNDPTIRYPLHGKDFMVLQPQAGAPCTFNITKGGEYARISRFHKLYEYERSIANKTTTEQNSKKESEIRAKEKPTPFLEGCSITVVGGQKKWFEDVVTETGAELIHDDGATPDRIYSDLKKSHALFLLLTSNSHRATWGCIEIVKEHNIPHFTIQGSKSNFRKLLWDNRELISTMVE